MSRRTQVAVLVLWIVVVAAIPAVLCLGCVLDACACCAPEPGAEDTGCCADASEAPDADPGPGVALPTCSSPQATIASVDDGKSFIVLDGPGTVVAVTRLGFDRSLAVVPRPDPPGRASPLRC